MSNTEMQSASLRRSVVTDEYVSTISSHGSFSRRSVLVAGATLGAEILFGRIAGAQSTEGSVRHPLKGYDIAANGITLHVTERGEGPAVLFCHGFPDTSYTWRRQMEAISSAGYRAIAPDMRGYGGSSAPADANLYTPLQTTGDLVGLLDALSIPNGRRRRTRLGREYSLGRSTDASGSFHGGVLSHSTLRPTRGCEPLRVHAEIRSPG
jgi:predicted alpha/beta-fold hydrolase